MADNLSAVLHGKLDLRMEQTPTREVKPGEVKVAMQNCGLCRTDLHMWQNGSCGDFIVKDPVIVGHESSGIVVECGDDVTGLRPGDRVALELGLPCRRCEFCKSGKYNLCKPFSLGALSRHMVYPADFCHKLPDHVSFEAGALIEPLAVGVRAARRSGVSLGCNVLVCGAGPIGLCSMLAAKAKGAAKVCITDVSDERLDLARKMGADSTLCVGREDARSLAVKVKDIIGDQPDVTIETSGAESSLKLAIYATKSGGTMSPVGLDPPEVTLPVVDAAVREVDIKGVFSYCNDYPAAIAIVASGLADPLPMITHRFTLEETPEAFELVKSGAAGVVKVMISCHGSK